MTDSDKISVTPATGGRIVLTREAARAVGCSMSLMRWLAKNGKARSWPMGPRSYGFDLDDCLQYKAEQDSIRAEAEKAGKRPMGSAPRGFSPDKSRNQQEAAA